MTGWPAVGQRQDVAGGAVVVERPVVGVPLVAEDQVADGAGVSRLTVMLLVIVCWLKSAVADVPSATFPPCRERGP